MVAQPLYSPITNACTSFSSVHPLSTRGSASASFLSQAVLAGEKLAPALQPLHDSSTQPDAAAAAAAAADGVTAGATLEEQ